MKASSDLAGSALSTPLSPRPLPLALPLNAASGTVHSLFGRPIPGGSLDNAAYAHGLSSDRRPLPPVLLPIEVKNVRHWLYPHAAEVYQLLYKAACLQRDEPDALIAPVLLCRARHFTLLQMSHDLGFRVINTRKQFILLNSSVRLPILRSVQTDLGFSDLVPYEQTADAGVTKALTLLPREAQSMAPTWRRIGSALLDHYRELRQETLSDPDRRAILADLRVATSGLLGRADLSW